MLNLHGPPAKGKLASSKVNFYFKRGDNDNLRDDGGHLGDDGGHLGDIISD